MTTHPDYSPRILALTLVIGSVPVQLPVGKPKFGEVRLRAAASNSGDIYLSDSLPSATFRYAIPSSGEETIKLTELSTLWVSGTAGDIVYLLAELEA